MPFFSLREHKSRVIFPVKGDHGIEALALFALEAFEQLGVPVGEQVFDFVVGQGASRFQPEHGQSALRVVAAYHLAVEPHPARAALGTRAAGVTAAEELVAREQFGGDFPCVRLYLLAEGVGGQFPALDACQLLLPFARHGYIGDAHRLDNGVEGKTLFSGDKRFLAAFHVTALEERFDDGGACGGSADAAVLHCLTQRVVLDFLARRFHSGQQGGFGVQRLGFGLSSVMEEPFSVSVSPSCQPGMVVSSCFPRHIRHAIRLV